MAEISNVVSQKMLPKGDIFGALKGEFECFGGSCEVGRRAVAGLDEMLGKHADITSRVVAA